MKLHVEALFTHDEKARIRCVNEPNGAKAPRLFLSRTAEGNLWRFRSDLPAQLVKEMERLCIDEPRIEDLRRAPRHRESYIALLQEQAPVQNVWAGPAYCFGEASARTSATIVSIRSGNSDVLRSGFEAWIDDVTDRRPFFAVLQAGRAVSLCCSVRITSEAHEAGVETLHAFRGRGYAPDVVSSWARAVRLLGCLPLYSTSWDNTASQRVAQKLALVAYGADFHIS